MGEEGVETGLWQLYTEELQLHYPFFDDTLVSERMSFPIESVELYTCMGDKRRVLLSAFNMSAQEYDNLIKKSKGEKLCFIDSYDTNQSTINKALEQIFKEEYLYRYLPYIKIKASLRNDIVYKVVAKVDNTYLITNYEESKDFGIKEIYIKNGRDLLFNFNPVK